MTKGINRGIIKAFREGVVTSASLLSVGRCFNDAVNLARENPSLDIGIHLCLTEEKPVLEKEDIPSLVNKDSYFLRPRQDFIFHYVFGRIKRIDIEKELDAQIKKALDSGLSLTHIDSHGYLHMLPNVLAVVIKLAKKYDIKIIRYPYEKISFYNFKWQQYLYFCLLDTVCLWARFNKEYKKFVKTDYFLGFLDSGHLSVKSFRKALAIFNHGISELVCHPGESDEEAWIYKYWKYDWQGELKVLISNDIKKTLKELNIESVSFKNIL